jgi:lysophospholipase L1-like esterase
MENHLFGKKIVFDGDSICHATSETADKNRGWAYRVGEKFGMEWYNVGVSGGTVTAEMYHGENRTPRHWVTRNIDKIYQNHPKLDYLIIEGGTNDADLLEKEPERFGEYSLSAYSGNYDDSTFTGALECLFFKALSYYPGIKIGYIVAPKMGRPEIGYGPEYKRRRFFLRAIEICKKWGVPYIDLWESSPLNPSLKAHFDPTLDPDGNRAAGKLYIDGQHLTKEGYDAVSVAIGQWIFGL